MRIGSRHDKMCGKMSDGGELPWADVIRYLGVVIIRGAKFKCSIDKAKRSFYRAVNGIFAKIGRLASEEVIISYVSTFEAKMFAYFAVCSGSMQLDKRIMQSLDFTFNRFFTKWFKNQLWKL